VARVLVFSEWNAQDEELLVDDVGWWAQEIPDVVWRGECLVRGNEAIAVLIGSRRHVQVDCARSELVIVLVAVVVFVLLLGGGRIDRMSILYAPAVHIGCVHGAGARALIHRLIRAIVWTCGAQV